MLQLDVVLVVAPFTKACCCELGPVSAWYILHLVLQLLVVHEGRELPRNGRCLQVLFVLNRRLQCSNSMLRDGRLLEDFVLPLVQAIQRGVLHGSGGRVRGAGDQFQLGVVGGVLGILLLRLLHRFIRAVDGEGVLYELVGMFFSDLVVD